jgi:uncharacterized repeat protein (TIGR01451 family)
VQADLRPFALGFSPVYDFTGGSRPSLAVGLVDSAARSGSGDAPWIYPRAYVLSYNTGSGGWSLSLNQDLNTPGLQQRHAGSTFLESWQAIPGYSQMRGWNPWRMERGSLPVSVIRGIGSVHYPQPMLTDIAFARDGQTIYLGLRDRTGDQVFSKNPPPGDITGVAQGDLLAYRIGGGSWQLQGAGPADTFDDNSHAYDGAVPAHIENMMGALALSLQGSGSTLSEQLTATALLGNSASGMRRYSGSGGGMLNQQQFISPADVAGGKASGLGDIEPLCSYALLGGRVWQDTNYDGIQNNGEPAFAGVTLELFSGSRASDPALARVTTDAQGRYLFAAPPNTPVNIRLAATSRTALALQGWHLTFPNLGGNDASDSDISHIFGYIEFAGTSYGSVGGGTTGIAIPMPLNRSDERSFDIGLTQVGPNGLIGDRVWSDTNRDGLQTSGEPGLAGVAVTLRPDPEAMAPLPGTYPRTTRTGSSGLYSFQSLPLGRYSVEIAPPAGFSATIRDARSNSRDTTDSDADASTGYRSPLTTIGAAPGNINRTIDFGLIGGSPDVWVAKSGPAQMLLGQQFSYTLDYGNSGAGQADLVQVRDTVPAGLIYLTSSPAPSLRSGQSLTWSLGSLVAGQTGRITITVQAPAGIGAAVRQPVANTASISTGTPGDPPGNNSDTSSGEVVRPEVGLTKTAPAAVLVGDSYSYSLVYANTGSIAAANVNIADVLPVGVQFGRFVQNPSSACSYGAAARRVSCSFTALAAGATGAVVFTASTDVSAAASLANTATISTGTAGDDPANNSATATTMVQFPNPGVGISITPSPFPVGTSGSISVPFYNSGTGVMRSAILTVDLPGAGYSLGALPAGCTYDVALRRIGCALGDLAVGASGTRIFSIDLPGSFSADSLSATARITGIAPERPADQADNSAGAVAPVVRPNVFVDAGGPVRIVAQGSVFWYVLDYGNQYRRNPSLTYAAQEVALRAVLPDDVTFLRASVAPAGVDGQQLSWDLGTLTAQQAGQIIIVVQTDVPAGATLHFTTAISTSTPGDDPSDNADTVDTAVVQPPSAIPAAGGDIRLAIHSDLDPNSQDSDPTNGVYLSEGTQISWPSGEVLDFTPRLLRLEMGGDDLPWPYEYRARVVGWSVARFTVNGAERKPHAPDSRGRSGCRPGAPAGVRLIQGCAYAYLGGEDLDAIENPATLREQQLRGQAHVYWTQPPAPMMRDDVYLYTVDPLEPAQIGVQLEVEVWIVNAYPGAPIDDPSIPEIPVVPLPDPARRQIAATFDVAMLVPRSLLGPGNR